MKQVDWLNYKFRPSSAGKLMTGSKVKGELGETVKSYLMEIYIKEMFGREKELDTKFFRKGNMAEENSIDLLSLVRMDFFKKNELKIENEFMIGTPDIIVESLDPEAPPELVIDTKTSWDIFSFAASKKTKNPHYEWQVQSYMWLTGARRAEVVYCLVDTPDSLIESEINKARYQAGVPEDSPVWIDYAESRRRDLKYQDMDKSLRLHTEPYDYDESKIEALKTRIIECREWLNNFNW